MTSSNGIQKTLLSTAKNPIDIAKPLTPTNPAQWSRSAMLRKCAHAFCMALANTEFDAHNFVSTFFVPGEASSITEHGPGWARKKLPFLGQTFQGRDGCVEYFQHLSQTLNLHLPVDAFPPDAELIVDPDAEVDGPYNGVVCVTGKGKFEAKETGWRWHEKFIYKLSGFDDDGRVTHWEIWSDPLSAWSALTQKSN